MYNRINIGICVTEHVKETNEHDFDVGYATLHKYISKNNLVKIELSLHCAVLLGVDNCFRSSELVRTV